MVLLTTMALLLGVGSDPLGALGLVLAAITIALLVWMIVRSTRSYPVTRSAVSIVTTDVPRPRYRWREIAFAYPYRDDPSVERIDDIEYAPGLGLDLHRSIGAASGPVPLLIHVHGGSWGGGHRRQQAIPMIRAMARRGWIVATIDYPLVPEATFPDQVVAIHGAVRWFRDHAAAYGIDPSAIFLTGGSAGAHLASLVALTDREGPWTNRRPDEDPIAGGVMFYGVYDLLDRRNIRDVWPVLSQALIKADPAREPDKFSLASPIDHVTAGAPPMLVIHGVADSLVPIEESQHFVERLRAGSTAPVAFAAIPGATHAFDAVPSLRTQGMVACVAAWLEAVAGR
jgi:acetyl esterase/lipase